MKTHVTSHFTGCGVALLGSLLLRVICLGATPTFHPPPGRYQTSWLGNSFSGAGNRKTVSFVSGAGEEAECVAAAGDYVFTGGWKGRGRVWLNRLSDGAAVGMFDPGPIVGGVENTGWIDILTGISAFKRSTGEYLVFVEEDYKGKVLLYRWKP